MLTIQTHAFIPERPAILIHGIGFKGGLTWDGIPLLRYLNLQNRGMTDFLVESGGYTLERISSSTTTTPLILSNT